MNKYFGVGVALVTPFNEDTSVDFKGFEKLIEFTLNGGVDYLVVLGTTGESATCSLEEKKQLLAKAIEVNNNRKPIVLGIGGNNTSEVVGSFSQFDLSNVDAILSASPYYNKPTQEGIYQHYKAVADASPKPIILYNVPGRTASNISSETTLRLAKHSNIIGIKEASGNLEQCIKIAKNKPKDFLLISGDDLLTTSMVSFGAIGVISVLANVIPNNFSKMVHLALENNFLKASEYLYQLIELNELMYTESNPVGAKLALELQNICSSQVRLPLVKGSENLKNQIVNQLKYNI